MKFTNAVTLTAMATATGASASAITPSVEAPTAVAVARDVITPVEITTPAAAEPTGAALTSLISIAAGDSASPSSIPSQEEIDAFLSSAGLIDGSTATAVQVPTSAAAADSAASASAATLAALIATADGSSTNPSSVPSEAEIDAYLSSNGLLGTSTSAVQVPTSAAPADSAAATTTAAEVAAGAEAIVTPVTSTGVTVPTGVVVGSGNNTAGEQVYLAAAPRQAVSGLAIAGIVAAYLL